MTRNPICKSIFFIDLVNLAGQRGMFQLVLDRISDTKNWASIDLTSVLVGIIGNLYGILVKEFAQSYIPKFKEAIWKNLLKSPEANIRNFTKDKIDSIVTSFEPLLKRAYTTQERQEVTFQTDLWGRL